jgi:hypothetical protein
LLLVKASRTNKANVSAKIPGNYSGLLALALALVAGLRRVNHCDNNHGATSLVRSSS